MRPADGLQQVLGASERYRDIFNAATDVMVLRDENYRVVDVNAAFVALTGFSREEALGQDRVIGGSPTESHAQVLERHRKVLAGEPVAIETQRLRKDGTRVDVELRCIPVHHRGRPHVLYTGRDIGERKRAEEALRASEEQYRSIFNAVEDWMVLRDAEFRVVDINAAYLAVIGRTREEVLGADRVLGHDAAELDQLLKSRHAGVLAGEPMLVETQRVRGDGRRIDVELRGVPVQYRGRPHVLYIGRDISERKRAEAALRASEEQYRSIFNSAGDSMVLRDADFRIVDVNVAFVAAGGYSREEVLGKDRVITTPPEIEPAIRVLHRRALAGEPVLIEVPRVRKDGARSDIELRGVPVQHRGQPHVLYIGRDISDRKRAEEALRVSEEQYRSIFNASQDAMVLRDADFRVVDVNAAYVVATGFSREETLGQDHVLGADPPEFEQLLRAQHHRVLAGETMVLETERVRRDGRREQRELRAVPVRHRGQPHVLYIGRDIGERKRVEEALRASEEQYREIFNASLDGMILRDAEFRVVDVNPAYERMSGYSRAEVVGKDRVVANPPEMNEPIKALHQRVLAGEAVMIETQSANKDGSRFELEMRGVPIHYRGRPHVLYIGRNISERKRAEEELRASEEQYRSIFNATSDALVLRDAEARVVDVNAAFLAMSGYSRDEVVNETRWFFADTEMSPLARRMHARVIAGESVHFEIRGRRKDGSLLEVEMHAVPMRYRGRPHALGMARDITARKRADAERVQLEAQLRQAQKMEAIGHLAGGIAHDFNNILTSIQGYAQLAAERPSAASDAKLSSHLDHLELACNRARELIQQMLVFSRGRRGAARALALAPVVRQAIRLLRSSLPATLEIVPEFAPELPAALLDPVQAEQVLMNLCINAHDAMQGRGTVQVGVTQRAVQGVVCASCRGAVTGTFVELAVADEGPGISAEVMDRMFEPFVTTKETGRGTGMGLAIVHGIVHEHGGHIMVESNAAGACFRVLLPTVAGEQAAEIAPRRRAAAPASPLKGRVLLVDDEQMVARFMRELLQGWGLKVTAVTSATEAKQVFTRAPRDFDLLLTDYTMPRMTGLDLAKALRAVRPRLPVIVYSGYTDVIPEAQLGAPPLEVVQKPIDQEALLAALTKHL